ncbi:uncharacterized protein LOC124262348 isoform X2 [Haliotis rubra]|uniref:uncharacterized protein LOC124262348 isoform X2 n=1 Tax=Haliotis rubra TaxID=36100 RepID=UPI001EE55723|nr:uncharacterized protein LOC124262348 isoform X2 [Haliotis rubra]
MRSVTIVFVELVLLSMVYAVTESPVTSAGDTNTTLAAVQPAKADNSSTNATDTPKTEGVNKTTTNYTEKAPAVTPSDVWVPAPEITCTLSSERCSVKSQCCSNRCVKLHSGADYRCLKSSVDKPCKHDYNCEGKLQCSPHRKTCCVDLWQSCVIASQCCNTEHRCLSMQGFIYKKCLKSDAIRAASAWGLMTLPSILAITQLMLLL